MDSSIPFMASFSTLLRNGKTAFKNAALTFEQTKTSRSFFLQVERDQLFCNWYIYVFAIIAWQNGIETFTDANWRYMRDETIAYHMSVVKIVSFWLFIVALTGQRNKKKPLLLLCFLIQFFFHCHKVFPAFYMNHKFVVGVS